MVDIQPSSDLDDLFDFGVPNSPAGMDSAPAENSYVSRRELRELRDAKGSSAAVPTRKLSKRKVRAMARSARDRQQLSRPSADRKAVARAMRDAEPTGPEQRKLGRADMRAMRASAAKPPRKNPLSVLVTMVVVGGMFAVAGLPAYALVAPTLTAAPVTDADAQSILVSSSAAALAPERDAFKATTPQELAEQSKAAQRAAANAAYLASGARGLGDDYPWPTELMDNQGGGLSPLRYYYRECVDFVAWRMNRDAGSYASPFKYVWSNLTPYGGNGGQWMYNWQKLGRTVSDTPIAGAVAYTGGNHIAYVKSVNGNGTVTLEEYNYVPGAYSQRAVAASSVVAFLYPPG